LGRDLKAVFDRFWEFGVEFLVAEKRLARVIVGVSLLIVEMLNWDEFV
jgi:hypothetical protein